MCCFVTDLVVNRHTEFIDWYDPIRGNPKRN